MISTGVGGMYSRARIETKFGFALRKMVVNIVDWDGHERTVAYM